VEIGALRLIRGRTSKSHHLRIIGACSWHGKEFNAWYKQEPYAKLAQCNGYVRTRRYKWTISRIQEFTGEEKGEPDPPSWLALHELEGETLPEEALPEEKLKRTVETEWAKKVMADVVGQEVKKFRLLGGFGDVNAKW
jgi:hypothetical protein